MAYVDELITYLGFETNLSGAQAFKNVVGQVGKAGVALAATITGTAASIGYFANSTARAVAENKDFAESINLSFADMQSYQYAIEKMGGSAESAQRDLKMLQMEALRNGETIDKTVERLSRSIDGMSAAAATSMLQDKAGLSPEAVELLRRGGAEVMKSLNELKDTYGVVSDESAENMENYVETVMATSNVIKTAFTDAIGQAIPSITDLVKEVKDWIAQNKEIIKSTVTTFIKGFTQGFKEAIAVIKNVLAYLKPVIGMFFDLSDGMDKTAIIAGIVKYAILALAVIMAGKFTLGLLSATRGLLSFSQNLYKTFTGLGSMSGALKTSVSSMVHYGQMVIKHPAMSAKLFANSLKNGIVAMGQWVATMVTKTIPAVIKFGLTMLVNGVKAVVSFVTSIFTTAIPALITFAATFFSTVIPAVWAFTVALLANPITWIVLAIVAAVAALVAAVIGLYKWFMKLFNATGSIGGALKIMGQTILKFLLTPINTVVDAIVGMLTLLSKIPVVGKKFKGAAESIKEFQDKANETLTGSKDKYDLTSPTMQALEKSKKQVEVSSAAKAVMTSSNVPVTSAKGAGNVNNTNNATMNQTINISGAANPNEVGRQVAERTSNSLQSISPGNAVPVGSF